MILQALKEYYDRKAADPKSGIAPEGFETKEIPFLVVIRPDGQLVHLEDTRERIGKKMVAKTFLLPRSRTRTGSKSYETTFLLWDHIGYLFGHPEGDEKTAQQHRTWLESLDKLPDELKQDEGVSAIIAFYRNGGVETVKSAENWAECMKLLSCNMTFRLAVDPFPVPCRPRVQEYARTIVAEGPSDDEKEAERVFSHCLVTGEHGEIVRTHGRTPIDKDTKSLVAFQKNSGYDSYGKEQCYNAPVCKSSEFAYTTGLNTLLKSESQRLKVGDASTVFWSSRDSRFESQVAEFFGEPPKDNPDRGTRAVEDLLRSVQTGAYVLSDRETRFYVLGLAPNAARIAIRFWHVGTVPEMAERFARHFEDTRIVHGPKEKDALSLFRLLVATAVLGKPENIPPNLAGDTMRAILEGVPYPATLLQAAVRRIKAEHEVTYPRAALVKACINRETRFRSPNTQEELHMALDSNNSSVGYRLGRLFATLEKIQQDASPGINATIRDRFYGAASSTPVAVFGNLMRLKNHHLAKLSSGLRIARERLIGEIMDGIADFPTHLALADQGRFAVGYYHQMQGFYTKKDKSE